METKFNWNQYMEEKDIKEINKHFDALHDLMIEMREKVTECQETTKALMDEKWKDAELTLMKFQLAQALREKNNGFSLTDENRAAVAKWRKEHDTKVHNNPTQYHGVSGGGITWCFYPSAVALGCDCICNACQRRAIQEAGVDWYERCKELGGVCEVFFT